MFNDLLIFLHIKILNKPPQKKKKKKLQKTKQKKQYTKTPDFK